MTEVSQLETRAAAQLDVTYLLPSSLSSSALEAMSGSRALVLEFDFDVKQRETTTNKAAKTKVSQMISILHSYRLKKYK